MMDRKAAATRLNWMVTVLALTLATIAAQSPLF
jgi:hypothetical protein